MNRMCIRLLRPPGGPLAEPTTNWDDALVRLRLPSVAEVSIPLDDGVADERVKSIPTTLNGRPAARRSFWGVTRSCHGRVCRGKGGTGPDPVNLFGAAMCGRINPNRSDARRVCKGQPHPEATKKTPKTSAQKERTIDSRGH